MYYDVIYIFCYQIFIQNRACFIDNSRICFNAHKPMASSRGWQWHRLLQSFIWIQPRFQAGVCVHWCKFGKCPVLHACKTGKRGMRFITKSNTRCSSCSCHGNDYNNIPSIENGCIHLANSGKVFHCSIFQRFDCLVNSI